MSPWGKVPDQKAPDYLEQDVRDGVIFYRVNYRKKGVALRKVLGEEFKSWKEADKAAERLIYAARFGEREKAPSLVRSEDVCKQLHKESVGQREKTIVGKKTIYFKHLIPWLNEHCPNASDLTVATWPAYKLYKRSADPTIALENHVKYFRSFAKRVFELGLIKQKILIKFDLKKEEFRSEGLVIPKQAELRILEAANRNWRDRSILGRDSGMRPGEIRGLRKGPDKNGNPANLFRQIKEDPLTKAKIPYFVIRLYAQDVKTNREREFELSSTRSVSVLDERLSRYLDSPFLFPMLTDHSRAMDKHQTGWKSALKKANELAIKNGEPPIRQDYTPHDWRHTYATEMFASTEDYATLCYQLDMSIETAQRVYLHFKAHNTRALADLIRKKEAGST